MSAADPHGLSAKQEEGIIALINNPSIAKAAAALGVNDRTVYRWFDDPMFSREYRKARRQAFKQAISISQKYAAAAVQTLVAIMADQKMNGSTRVSAAEAVLRFSRDSIELDDLEGRLEALEGAKDGNPPPPYQPMDPEPVEPGPMPPAPFTPEQTGAATDIAERRAA